MHRPGLHPSRTRCGTRWRAPQALLAALSALLLGQGAAAQSPAPGQPAAGSVAPPPPGSAVQPAPAMTPSGRVTPGGVRNAHRQAQGGQAGTPVAADDPGTAGGMPAPVTAPAPPSMWTPAQAREAFRYADSNGDGVLSRAEAQRLPVMPRSFEDLDANKDGVLDLDEFLAGFQR